jgi:hypothetical protein
MVRPVASFAASIHDDHDDNDKHNNNHSSFYASFHRAAVYPCPITTIAADESHPLTSSCQSFSLDLCPPYVRQLITGNCSRGNDPPCNVAIAAAFPRIVLRAEVHCPP